VKLHGIEEYAFQADNVATINIPASVEVLFKFCFSDCQLFTSITFESNSKLHQIEGSAFAGSGLTISSIPAFVEMLSKFYFSDCKSLASITSESNKKQSEATANSFARSPRLHHSEYSPSFRERSRAVTSRSAGPPSSLIADKD
jgi:hypothetical protein